jgi:uncharacterized membrane protein YphA (DoxX/SURF4 family)
MRLPGEILQGILARAALALLRVYLGLAFVLTAVPKLQDTFTDVPTHSNAQLFGSMVSWGELLVGALLILGLVTRLSAAAALLLTLNYMWAKEASPDLSSNDTAFVAISLALLFGAAGRTFGLDAMLARRWPRSPFW